MKLTVYAIVKRLIGPIYPIGEENRDSDRLENMRQTALLVEELIADIQVSAAARDRQEASMKAIGDEAYESLRDIADSLKEFQRL